MSENILCRSFSIKVIYKDKSGKIYIADLISRVVQIRLVRN